MKLVWENTGLSTNEGARKQQLASTQRAVTNVVEQFSIVCRNTNHNGRKE